MNFFSPFEDCGYLWNTYAYVVQDAADEGSDLARYLLENGTLICGAAMPQILKYPKSMLQKKLKRGEFTFRRDGNFLMVHLQDKKEIFFVLTIHSAKTCNGEEKNQGKFVLNKVYNKYMGGKDNNDALIGN